MTERRNSQGNSYVAVEKPSVTIPASSSISPLIRLRGVLFSYPLVVTSPHILLAYPCVESSPRGYSLCLFGCEQNHDRTRYVGLALWSLRADARIGRRFVKKMPNILRPSPAVTRSVCAALTVVVVIVLW